MLSRPGQCEQKWWTSSFVSNLEGNPFKCFFFSPFTKIFLKIINGYWILLKTFFPHLRYSHFSRCDVPPWQVFIYSDCFSKVKPTWNFWDELIKMLTHYSFYILPHSTFRLLAFHRILRLRLSETSPSFSLLMRPWSVTLATGREREEDTQAPWAQIYTYQGTRPWPSLGNCVRGAPPGGHRAQQPDELDRVSVIGPGRGSQVTPRGKANRPAAQLQRWVTRTNNDATCL